MNRARIVLEARASMKAEGLRVPPLFHMAEIVNDVLISHGLSKRDNVPFVVAMEAHAALLREAKE